MPEFKTAAERAAYWQGRHEEAADALQHERARIERFLLVAVEWAQRPKDSEITSEG
jgi:hypothetical protein